MLINIKMLTEEAYVTLQKNYKDVYTQIKNHPSDCSWLEDYLGFAPFETKKYLVEDFDLKDSENYSEVALENGIELYEKLKQLPRYVLCNSRFWLWVTFEKAYKQAQHAMDLRKAELVRDFWLTGDSRRSLMLGVISRSFFRTEISVDEERTNPYELTEIMIEGSKGLAIYRALTYRNIGMLKQVSLAYLQCIKDMVEKYGDIALEGERFQSSMKDASRIGSVMLIDDLSKEEIYEVLQKKYELRMCRNINA